MKWLTAVLTFVNFSVVCGLLLGMAGRGLNTLSAALALVCGAAFAVAAFLGTSDPAGREKTANPPEWEQKPQNASQPESQPGARTWSAIMRYRRVWFWAMAVCFAMFAVRSFCWLFYIDGSDYKIQSPNNLGDLSLHLTLIKTFANGVPLWPDNPIYVASKLRYPAGIDLFNALLSLVHVDLITGLCWVGLSAVASAKADDAGGCAAVSANTNELGQSAAVEVRVNPKGPLPLWSALALYASMPLYNLHTFIALTVVLVFALVLERPSEIKYIVNLTRNEGVSGLGRLTSHPRMWPEIFRGAPIRRHAAATLALALVPASFFVWLVTDHFHAASVL